MTWDLMLITSMGNHGAAGDISERRCSSCSSLIWIDHFSVEMEIVFVASSWV